MSFDGRTTNDLLGSQAGFEPSGSVAAGTVRTINVTFDTPFPIAPVVVPFVLVNSSTAVVRAWLAATTTTGCTIFAVRDDTATAITVGWVAHPVTQ